MEPETKLAICLRFLAGGDPLDLKLIYDVSKSYVYSCVWRVADAINATFPVEFPLADVGKLRVLEAEFRPAPRATHWAFDPKIGPADLWRLIMSSADAATLFPNSS